VKAVVTGAAGFIGSHLSESLVNAGHSVTGIDVFTDYYARERKEQNLARLRTNNRFTLLETALADVDWPRVLEDGSWIFHLAAQAGVRKSWGRDFHVYTVNNVEGTQVLLEACKGRPIERLVYASSSSVYGDDVPLPMREDARPQPVSPYGVTKLSAEQLCHLYCVNYQVPAVSMRYFTVYGPRQRPDMAIAKFTRAIARGEPIALFGDGTTRRDYTFIDDIVRGVVASIGAVAPGCYELINLGGTHTTSLRELVEILERVIGRPAVLDWQPSQPGDVPVTYASIDRARALLGYEPTTRPEVGIAQYWAWYQGRGA